MANDSDDDDWRQSAEETRVEIEQVRLELDRFRASNQSHKLYLDQWQIDLTPVEKRLSESDQLAGAFAQSGIKSMFFLNGGALIALPAYRSVLGIATQASATLSSDRRPPS